MDSFLELIKDLHLNNDRQGPGQPSDTIRALELLHLESNQPLKIADIGCGTGGQTLTLAQHTQGHITAIDVFDDFLDVLEQKAKVHSLEDRITTLNCSMDELPFKEHELDMIWSEGAIYNIGFESGIKSWGKYIKPGGYLAVSEITWITSKRPSEIQNFWESEYPEIGTAGEKIQVLESNGFSLAGYFYLPQSSWLSSYYEPLMNEFEPFLKRQNNSPEAQELIEENLNEINLYKKYKNYYSYGFYVAIKR